MHGKRPVNVHKHASPKRERFRLIYRRKFRAGLLEPNPVVHLPIARPDEILADDWYPEPPGEKK